MDIPLSLTLYLSLHLSVLAVCSSCMCLSADPLVQQIVGSLSLWSQLDRDTSTLHWASSKPPSYPAASTPAFLSFSLSTSPDLSYTLSHWEMADKCPCCGYNPSTAVLLFLLSLLVALLFPPRMCNVKMVTQRSITLLQYCNITRFKKNSVLTSN